MLDWRADRAGRSSRLFVRLELGIRLIQLPHLAVSSPTNVVVPSVSQVGVGDLLETTRQVEPGRKFIGKRFILDKPVGVRGADGLFVKMLSIELAALDASDLGAHQGGAVLEILRAILRPDFELSMMGHQSLEMLLLRPAEPDFGGQVLPRQGFLLRNRGLVLRSFSEGGIAARRAGKRTIEVILRRFKK